MSTIAFLTPPFYGHVLPTLAIGEGLIQQGHTVHWGCPVLDLEGVLPQGGYLHRLKLPKVYQKHISSRNVSVHKHGLDSVYSLYEETLIPLNRVLCAVFENFLKDISPDLVIVDHQAFAGAVVCTTMEIPFVTNVTAPAAIDPSSEFPRVIAYENDRIVQFQKEMGVEVAKPLICNSELTLICTLADFVQQSHFKKTYQFIGPLFFQRNDEVSFPYEKLHRKAPVYCPEILKY